MLRRSGMGDHSNQSVSDFERDISRNVIDTEVKNNNSKSSRNDNEFDPKRVLQPKIKNKQVKISTTQQGHD